MATKMLSEKLGEVEYDNLIVGLTPPKRVGAGKIASTGSKEATYTRGTVFAKSAKDGKLYILGSTAASGDTLTADCILTDDVTVPATGDATTTVYLAGCFNPDKLVVKSASTTLTAGTDYTAAFDDDGYVTIAIIPGGKAASATSLTVSGTQIDPTAVTADDVVGGVNAQGVETGMEVIRQIYPALNMTPGILLAPGWSENATVAAGLQAKTTGINGVFRAVCIVDVDSSTTGAKMYTGVKQQKEKQAITSANCYPVWLYAKVGDVVYAGSAMAAALTVATDAANGDIPYVSPSNKTLAISAACLKDGTEVLLDQEQANVVNSFGVATWLNMSGFRLWGNNTACYPGNTDPKDRWLSVRRFMNWDDNTFIQTYFQKVDDPLNKRLIEALVDSENVRGNSFVSRGICARHEIQYIESENPTTSLLNGCITFHKYLSPFNPAEDIEELVEFDPNAISDALGG